ncbi:hypothetical protein [Shewanella sp. SM32]|uniref:hypothetical protein n=1 Tax=Shewanella sp. SM32 TaxID=2912796 RepID=UPI0021DACBE9|nr:hypothetical protein [Shewanella sp. SM32]MCU8070990.1 hypothetical protein [Shewanella sp. SM32]
MKFGTIIVFWAALLSAPSYADENSSIGFKTVALAMEALKIKKGRKLVCKADGQSSKTKKILIWSYGRLPQILTLRILQQ